MILRVINEHRLGNEGGRLDLRVEEDDVDTLAEIAQFEEAVPEKGGRSCKCQRCFVKRRIASFQDGANESSKLALFGLKLGGGGQ